MCNYIVTNEETEKAEKDIFENGEHFNDEQKTFLKYLDSCCVQAYAGTGKTSTLVGKLHVLAQKNVWQNGRGICVISHTNVAVDEIKKHVAKHYPTIMQYPNFIGTIQEFINQFIFNPYLASKGFQIKFQDESRYFDYKLELPENIVERINNYISSKINHSPDLERARKDFFERLKTAHVADNKLYARAKNNKFTEYTDLETRKVTQSVIVNAFCNLIQNKHKDGYFLFIESFIDGFEYIKQNPILKSIISQRFQFVFLDEAQDCSEIQLNILKELFSDNTKTVFQQIGDINQAITETVWSPSENILSLNQSTRFGNNIAGFINKFKVDDGSGVSGMSEDTKRFLITYNLEQEKNVLKKFAEIIKNEDISTDKDFFAISHQHEQLSVYFPDYSEKLAKNKNKKTSYRFDADIDYINLLTREFIQQQGSNFVSKILFSLLYKHFKVERNSWNELKEYLRTGEKMDNFKKLVLNISRDILQNGKITNLDDLKNKLNIILGGDKIDFTNDARLAISTPIQNQVIENKIDYGGIEINIGTIHSVKGQTHNATLCFSNKEFDKYDIGHALLNNKNSRTLFYKRLLYVSSSRPKYLFAFAVENSAYSALTDKTMFQGFNQIIL